jgi:hypothetical protein
MQDILITSGFGLVTILMVVIGFFLKTVHTDVKDNTLDIGKLKGKTDLIQANSDNKIDNLTKVTEMQIGQLTESVNKLTDIIAHMNGNWKSGNDGVAILLEKVLDRLESDARS